MSAKKVCGQYVFQVCTEVMLLIFPVNNKITKRKNPIFSNSQIECAASDMIFIL